MKTEKPIVLLVGDDPSYLDMLGYVLEAEGFSPLLPASDRDLASPSLTSEIDLVVLDGRPPEVVERRLKQLKWQASFGDDTPIICLTDQAPAANGALGCITAKASEHKAIIESLRRAHEEHVRSRPRDTLSYADVEMDVLTHRVWRAGREIHLTPTEFRLLKYFLEHPDKVFSRKQLADAVWHVKPTSGGRTVDVHVARLRKALGTEPERNLIQTVWTVGYLLTAK